MMCVEMKRELALCYTTQSALLPMRRMRRCVWLMGIIVFENFKHEKTLCFSLILAYLQQYITKSPKFVCTRPLLFQRQCLHTFDSCVEMLVFSYNLVKKIPSLSSTEFCHWLWNYRYYFCFGIGYRFMGQFPSNLPHFSTKYFPSFHCTVWFFHYFHP